MSSISPVASTTRSATYNLVRRLHFYIGLFIAPFIFVAALSGTLYVLTPQIENLLYQDALFVQPQGTAKPLAQQVAAARHYAGEQTAIYALRPAPGANETTRVQFIYPDSAPSESRAIFVDPYTLSVKGDMTVYGTSGVLPLRMWLDKLHRGLLLGDAGRSYSELAASWLWLAALGGVVLWLNVRPRRRRGKVKGRLALSRHWHATLGLALLLGLLFFSVTGLTWSQWAGENINHMRASFGWLTPQVKTDLAVSAAPEVADAHADHDGMAMPVHANHGRAAAINQPDADWGRVLAAARAVGISADKVELRQPSAQGKAWTVTEVDRSWPTRVDAVAVNPATFAIVDQTHFANFPLVAKLTRWGVDAHMGVLFGLPNQLILAVFGFGLCALIVLGYRMWWLRRPAQAQSSPAETLVSCWLTFSLSGRVLTLLLALVAGYCLPMMGASLIAFVALDVLRWKRNQQQHQRAARSLLPSQQSPLSIIQDRIAVKKKETRRFIRGVIVVAMLVVVVMGKAIISGVVEQYQIPLSEWSTQMVVTQTFMILLYTLVFTALLSVPLWYFFLGENDEQ